MFCPKCGTQVPDGAKFCPTCGAALSPAAGAAASGPAAGAPGASGSGSYGPGSYGPGAAPGSPVVGGSERVARIVKIVAAAVMIVSFFLPLVGVTVFGYDFNFSAFQGTFGFEIMGSHIDGVPQLILFVVPGIVALLFALVAKGKAGDVMAIVCGVAIIVLLWLNMSNANDSLGVYVALDLLVGGWLFILSGIASIVAGVMGLIKK